MGLRLVLGIMKTSICIRLTADSNSNLPWLDHIELKIGDGAWDSSGGVAFARQRRVSDHEARVAIVALFQPNDFIATSQPSGFIRFGVFTDDNGCALG